MDERIGGDNALIEKVVTSQSETITCPISRFTARWTGIGKPSRHLVTNLLSTSALAIMR